VRPHRLALALLLCGSAAYAGTEITIETRKAGAPADAKPQLSHVAVEGRMLSFDAGDGRHGFVYRGEEGVLQILDHRKKSVLRIDRDTALGMSRSLSRLPAAEREAVEGLLGTNRAPAKVELRATGRSERVSGTDCKLIEALRDGARFAEICEGPTGALGVTPAALAPARELAELVAEVGAALPKSLGGEALDALAVIRQVKGVPLRVRTWPEGHPATESRIASVMPKHFGPERFQPPADYRSDLGVRVGP